MLSAHFRGVNWSIILGKDIDFNGIFMVQNELLALRIRLSSNSNTVGFDHSHGHALHNFTFTIFQEHLEKISLFIDATKMIDVTYGSFSNFDTSHCVGGFIKGNVLRLLDVKTKLGVFSQSWQLYK